MRAGIDQITLDDETRADDGTLRVHNADDRGFKLNLRRRLPSLVYKNALSGNRIFLVAAR
jgi:hypothetical protein